jgi:RNA polymerase sigma-70 factor (ECF subfamily)
MEETMFDNQRLENSMKRLKQGDLEAFDDIYEQTHRMVYYVIYHVLGDTRLSEDVMQDTYMRIIDKISQYEPNTTPKAWIAQIAKNLALNEIKKVQKMSTIDSETLDVIPDSTPKKETPLIDLAKKNLPEDEFLILMLCIGEGYTRREASKIVGLSTSGVTWKLQEAMKKMKKLVKEEF